MVAEPCDGLGTVLDSITDSRVEERVHLEQGHLFGMFQVKSVVDGYNDKSTVGKRCAAVDHVLIVASTGDEATSEDIKHAGMVSSGIGRMVNVQFQLRGVALAECESLLGMQAYREQKRNRQ